MDYKSLERHPASAAWGDMSDAEFAQLKKSIGTDGFRSTEPVIVLKGTHKVVDGWHRLQAAIETGKVPTVLNKGFVNGDALAAYIISKHTARRNLPQIELDKRAVKTLVACGVGFAERGRPEAKEPVVEDQPAAITPKVVVERAGGSESTARRAIKQVKDETRAAEETPEQAAERIKAESLKRAKAKVGRKTPKQTAEETAAHYRSVAESTQEFNDELRLQLAEAEGADKGDLRAEYEALLAKKDKAIADLRAQVADLKGKLKVAENEAELQKTYAAEMEKAVQRQQLGE